MGLIYVNVGVSNPSDWRALSGGHASSGLMEEVRVLVDTGATLSVFPSALLERLGIQRTGQRRFRGFGSRLVRDIGTANLTYQGDTAGMTVVFGEEDEPAILGVTALETLGFQVDPVEGQLYRVEMLI